MSFIPLSSDFSELLSTFDELKTCVFLIEVII